MPKSKKLSSEFISVIPSQVMEKIHLHNIAMKPNSYFVMKKVVVGLFLTFFILLGVFFGSITLFKLVNIQYFGARFLLQHLPWFSGGLALCSVLVTFALLEYYRVFYKVSLVTLFIGVCFVFGVLSFVANKTSISSSLSKGRLSILYQVEERPLDVYAGRVLEVHARTGFVLETLRGDKIKIYIPSGTNIPEGGIVEGESLLIAGYYKGGLFQAKGILSIGRKSG